MLSRDRILPFSIEKIYDIIYQRQCRTVSSPVRYFTGPCPISRNQGRIMLQYWEGNLTYLLREIDNFQKTNNSDYFLLWYTSIQEGAFRQSSKQTDNDREASVYILLQVNENWIEAFKFNNPFSPRQCIFTRSIKQRRCK